MGAHDWLGELTTNGVIAPLELGDKASDFLPVALDASTYNGVVYELPYAVENLAMLRNADLVPDAGHQLRRHDRQGQGGRRRVPVRGGAG